MIRKRFLVQALVLSTAIILSSGVDNEQQRFERDTENEETGDQNDFSHSLSIHENSAESSKHQAHPYYKLNKQLRNGETEKCSYQSEVSLKRDNETLKSVVMLFRHGDRNPIGLGSTKNPNKRPGVFVGALGQLTSAGKRRMYHLGQYTRRRYAHFLSSDPDEVYARSTDIDRCIASASLVLAGLYPPRDEFIWSDSVTNWQPIPIHTVPLELDFVLKPTDSQKEIGELFKKMNEPQLILQDMLHYLELANRDLGMNYTNFEQVQWLYNDLKCQYEQNLPLPEWYDDKARDDLHNAAVRTQAAFTSTLRLKQLRSGPMLNEIFYRLTTPTQIDSEGTEYNKKISLYCTHDTEIAALLSTLSVWDNKMPDYGSAIFFELHQDGLCGPVVKMFHLRNSYSGEIEELKPWGSSVCDLGAFQNIVAKYQIDAISETSDGE